MSSAEHTFQVLERCLHALDQIARVPGWSAIPSVHQRRSYWVECTHDRYSYHAFSISIPVTSDPQQPPLLHLRLYNPSDSIASLRMECHLHASDRSVYRHLIDLLHHSCPTLAATFHEVLAEIADRLEKVYQHGHEYHQQRQHQFQQQVHPIRDQLEREATLAALRGLALPDWFSDPTLSAIAFAALYHYDTALHHLCDRQHNEICYEQQVQFGRSQRFWHYRFERRPASIRYSLRERSPSGHERTLVSCPSLALPTNQQRDSWHRALWTIAGIDAKQYYRALYDPMRLWYRYRAAVSLAELAASTPIATETDR